MPAANAERAADDGSRQVNIRLSAEQIATLPEAPSLTESVRLALEKGLAADVDPDAKTSLDGVVSAADFAAEAARQRHMMMLLSAQIVAAHENVLRVRAVADYAVKLLRLNAGVERAEANEFVLRHIDWVIRTFVVEADTLHGKLCALAQGMDDPDLENHGVRVEIINYSEQDLGPPGGESVANSDARPAASPTAAE